MPNFRFRLPSRNWTIFFTIVGSWSGAVWYDRREKKRIQQKWCDAVSHLRTETLPPDMIRRKLLVVLSAPPADGLLSSREHFHEYIRPILVAGGMDWEAIEGRKEGDVRAMIAERIRDYRRRKGEIGGESTEEERDIIIREIRERLGVVDEPGIQGDIVIGRNTWKEYVRGLHEGWLGPLEEPEELRLVREAALKSEDSSTNKNSVEEAPSAIAASSELDSFLDQTQDSKTTQANSDIDSTGAEIHSSAGESKKEMAQPEGLQDSSEGEKKKETEEQSKPQEPKKRKQPSPFIYPESYSAVSIPNTIDSTLGPSVTVTYPHILGIRHMPIRIWRFLHKRELADQVGKEVAAAVLASYTSYQQTERSAESLNESSPSTQINSNSRLSWEQEHLLESEESGWHKSVKKREGDNAGTERVWLDPVILDDRVASRMRKFVVKDDWESRDP
jgi:mitochondrial import inner membrane translocase subunit TIM54